MISGLPPHCVAAIEFSPPLPRDHQLLLESMPVGHLTKFIVTYNKVQLHKKKILKGRLISPLLSPQMIPLSYLAKQSVT